MRPLSSPGLTRGLRERVGVRASTKIHQALAPFARAGQRREGGGDGLIDLALERHDQVGQAFEPFPAPLVELRPVLAASGAMHVDLLVVAALKADLARADIEMSDHRLRKKMAEAMAEATQSVKAGK